MKKNNTNSSHDKSWQKKGYDSDSKLPYFDTDADMGEDNSMCHEDSVEVMHWKVINQYCYPP